MLARDFACEDLAYTKQLFTITGRGHSRPTAEFGAPTMVWHVSFWPRRSNDPHDFDLSAGNGKLKEDYELVDDHNDSFKKVMSDFNKLLIHLQTRGCVRGADNRPPFEHDRPRDWDDDAWLDEDGKPKEPFGEFTAECSGFTLWWPDESRSPATEDDTSSLLGDGPKALPYPTDLRVRVQAEVTEDFSSITFFIDAGKPWDQEPAYSKAEAETRGLAGARRSKIFESIESIKDICQRRLIPIQGVSLVDIPMLPERIVAVPPETGQGYQAWHEAEMQAAITLREAADYLYGDLWEQFCRDFCFNLCDIAGKTDEVFANFRGLIISTAGIPGARAVKWDAAKYGLGQVKEETYGTYSPETADCGLRPFPRFDGAQEGYESDAVESNAVVKAWMPFMRRFRPDADWRDWIACGIFDWRAIYITPLGAPTRFKNLEEGRLEAFIPTAETLPCRQRTLDADYREPATLKNCSSYAEGRADDGSAPDPRELTSNHKGDRPSPFRFLLLTKGEPNRRQVGRMVERINTTGVYRLYALKNWTIIQQANIWIRVYGQKLDEAYQQWIREMRDHRKTFRDMCAELEKNFDQHVSRLPRSWFGGRWEEWRGDKWGRRKAYVILKENSSLDSKIAALSQCQREKQPRPPGLLASFGWEWLLRRKRRNCRKVWNGIRETINDHRLRKHDFQTALSDCNRRTGDHLLMISSELDNLGKVAIGGLSYRVSRSRLYALMYRDSVKTLRDGNIETWWSYKQFAIRGMEPALRFIKSIGTRLDKLRDRIQMVEQAILQDSISAQTEATRDHTYELAEIQAALGDLTTETQQSQQRAHTWQRRHYIVMVVVAITNALVFGLLAALIRTYPQITPELMSKGGAPLLEHINNGINWMHEHLSNGINWAYGIINWLLNLLGHLKS
jgi:hypothetical protein